MFKKSKHQFSIFSSENRKGRNVFSNSYYETRIITLIPKPKIAQKETTYYIPHEYKCKENPYQNISNRIHQCIQRIIYNEQVGLISSLQDWFNIRKSV